MCSVVTSSFSGAKTSIFWDLNACPIPKNLTPASIYDNFKETLGNVGYTGEISIVAYSYKSLTNAQEFESANISFCKKSNILVDIFAWAIRNRVQPTNILVISQDTPHYVDYSKIKEYANNILLAFPEATSGSSSRVPSGVPSSVWLWSSLSNGGSPLNVHLDNPQIGTTLCGCCKKETKKGLQKNREKKPKELKNRRRDEETNDFELPQTIYTCESLVSLKICGLTLASPKFVYLPLLKVMVLEIAKFVDDFGVENAGY